MIFAAAASILQSGDRAPVGWSIRRLFHICGNVAVTPHRIFVQSNFLSPMTALWAALALAASAIAIIFADAIFLILAIVALVLIAQRRPFIRDIPVHMIYEVRFGAARGATGRADIMMISTAEGMLHITTSKPIPATVRDSAAGGRRTGFEYGRGGGVTEAVRRHIRKIPKDVSAIGAFSAADKARDSTRRLSIGVMMPSSHSRAVA